MKAKQRSENAQLGAKATTSAYAHPRTLGTTQTGTTIGRSHWRTDSAGGASATHPGQQKCPPGADWHSKALGWAGLSLREKIKKRVRNANRNELSQGRQTEYHRSITEQWLMVGGGWWRLAVGGWWRLAVGGGRLVVPRGCPEGLPLTKKELLMISLSLGSQIFDCGMSPLTDHGLADDARTCSQGAINPPPPPRARNGKSAASCHPPRNEPMAGDMWPTCTSSLPGGGASYTIFSHCEPFIGANTP